MWKQERNGDILDAGDVPLRRYIHTYTHAWKCVSKNGRKSDSETGYKGWKGKRKRSLLPILYLPFINIVRVVRIMVKKLWQLS